jgi:hypothetical protein
MTTKLEYLNAKGRAAVALAMARALANALDTNWSLDDGDVNRVLDALEPVMDRLNQNDFFGTEGWERWIE